MLDANERGKRGEKERRRRTKDELESGDFRSRHYGRREEEGRWREMEDGRREGIIGEIFRVEGSLLSALCLLFFKRYYALRIAGTPHRLLESLTNAKRRSEESCPIHDPNFSLRQ